jgi:hypothetical protein
VQLRDYSLSVDFRLKWCAASFCLTSVYVPTDEEAKQLFLAELSPFGQIQPSLWWLPVISIKFMLLPTKTI